MAVRSFFHPVLVLLPVLVWYLYRKLSYRRYERYKGLAMPRSPSLLFGHLEDIGKAMRAVGAMEDLDSRHPDYAFELLRKEAGNDGAVYLDMWPVEYPTVQIWSHSLAEQISKSTKLFKYSVDKSPTVHAFSDLIGKDSIFSVNGEEWKSLRKIFNSGFAPQHLMTLLASIVEKTGLFHARLEELSKSGDIFELNELTTDLTFDIIGSVVLDTDMNAQDATKETHPILVHLKRVLPLFDFHSIIEKVKPAHWVKLVKRGILANRVNSSVKAVIRQKFRELHSQTNGAHSNDKGRSVLSLSLKGLTNLTPELEENISAQIRTFLFAGHDTTSIALQWAFYFLYRHPDVRTTLVAELDSILGPDQSPTGSLQTILDRGEDALSKLPFLSAVIKETLRLYPPASAARMAPPGSGMMLQLDNGTEVCIDGLIIYVVHQGIMRDPAVFGPDENEFRPARWMGNTDMSMAAGGLDVKEAVTEQIPASAWRPFERGPRNCIGQELANLEAKTILASTVRGFEFEKVGLGQMENGKLVGGELYKKYCITSRPCDNMRMKVKAVDKT
ncbi:cytochrome P450 [Microthyrium microscopicum]|uniref:Cytochrome P450 n=1 Tax=Microthyrium microscopicum TaxID=703497 RepID=A0A6A6ULF0_9PEZI|nr:cytochrome P450 [Microthyrium microscopicum]